MERAGEFRLIPEELIVRPGKESGRLTRFMRKQVTCVDRSPLFRPNRDGKGNLETDMTVLFGVDENIDFFFFFASWNLTGSVHVWVFST